MSTLQETNETIVSFSSLPFSESFTSGSIDRSDMLEMKDRTPCRKERIKATSVSPNCNLKLLAAVSCEKAEKKRQGCGVFRPLFADDNSMDSTTDSTASSYECSVESELLFDDEVETGISQNTGKQSKYTVHNRKNKSLGVLCHK